MAAPTRIITTLETLSADPRSLAGPQRVAVLGDIQAARSWIDAREAEWLGAMHAERDDVDAGAKDITQLVKNEANVGFGEAKRRATRAIWLDELPTVADALATGTLGTAHVDELCALAERLPTTHRPVLRDALPALIVEVASLTVAKARRHLADFEASLDADDDQRLERQRRTATLRFTKNGDDTVGVHGTLDPVDGTRVRNAIDAKVAALWRRESKGRGDAAVPANVLSSGTWRARALAELVIAGSAADPATRGRPQIIVLIDHQTLLNELGGLGAGGVEGRGVVRLDDGTPIPAAEARRLACGADIVPMVLGGAGQPLDVGRAARLATDAQRTALRVVHPTCCIGGCDVAFDHCEVHHLDWWRLGGQSDLDNLKPLCGKHHHLVHDHRWDIVIDPEGVGRLVRRHDRHPIQTSQRLATSDAGHDGAGTGARRGDPLRPPTRRRPARPSSPRTTPAETQLQPMRC